MIERTREVPRTEWRSYFDHVSKQLEGRLAEIEVAELQLGDQIEAEWVPFHGIVYDDKDDLFEIAVEGLDHLISKPVKVWVGEGSDSLKAVEIEDADGKKHIVKLREPLALHPPQTE